MPTETPPSQTSVVQRGETLSFARRVLVATLVVVGVLLLLLFIWYAADLLMLVFAAVLIAILLRTLTDFVQHRTGLGYGLSLTIVSVGLVVLIALTVWLVMDRIVEQMGQLRTLLPQAIQNVNAYIARYPWAQNAVDNLPNPADWVAARGGTIVSQFAGLASSTLGGIVNAIIVFIIGVYLASQPDIYARGLNHLVPFGYRARLGEILNTSHVALQRWLLGRFGLMFLNGGLTAIGLWILGVPLAFTLGVLAGILNFVPNFGPWVAAIPAVLVAFLQGPQQALYVGLLYIALQSIDGYVLTPIVDRKSVELPPVLTIVAQILLGLGFGFIGILLASPLTAVVMILVKTLYVEDLLGDRMTFEKVTRRRPAKKQRATQE
ncbi:MAG TPA: AI-2E family transporter [Pyrinomonadaceae bacterium]|nr:AI-2E family transporter [Pyrinomonadaceae bacterium]